MMKVWLNKECGNIHFTRQEALLEGMEMYDLGSPFNLLTFDDYYEEIILGEQKIGLDKSPISWYNTITK